MSGKEKLKIQLEFLEEIRSKMYGYSMGSLGFTAAFTERQLEDMKKELEDKINNE